jgi:hypothetical protein
VSFFLFSGVNLRVKGLRAKSRQGEHEKKE